MYLVTSSRQKGVWYLSLLIVITWKVWIYNRNFVKKNEIFPFGDDLKSLLQTPKHFYSFTKLSYL